MKAISRNTGVTRVSQKNDCELEIGKWSMIIGANGTSMGRMDFRMSSLQEIATLKKQVHGDIVTINGHPRPSEMYLEALAAKAFQDSEL